MDRKVIWSYETATDIDALAGYIAHVSKFYLHHYTTKFYLLSSKFILVKSLLPCTNARIAILSGYIS